MNAGGEDVLLPTFLGDTTGRWETETLVVDVLSFNGETWLAGAEDKPTNTSTGVWPTWDGMHVVERWRRIDADTLEFRARVEDPTMLTGPWEPPAVVFKRQPVGRIEEVKCMINPPGSRHRQWGDTSVGPAAGVSHTIRTIAMVTMQVPTWTVCGAATVVSSEERGESEPPDWAADLVQ